MRTIEAARYGDSWSFRGLGRWLYQRAARVWRPGETKPDLVPLDKPHEEAPVGPDEPRG